MAKHQLALAPDPPQPEEVLAIDGKEKKLNHLKVYGGKKRENATNKRLNDTELTEPMNIDKPKVQSSNL